MGTRATLCGPTMKQFSALVVVVASVWLVLADTGHGQTRQDKGVRRASRPVPNQYIVVLQDNEDADAVSRETEAVLIGRVKHLYRRALKGFAIRLPAAAAEKLARDPRVQYVEEDGVLSGTQVSTPWGLDRIDQRQRPLDGLYNHDSLGTGVSVHVIDTGI